MDNNIHFYGSNDGKIAFCKSSIEASKKMIEHYDFVINDISSNISDARLEATKSPALSFLKDMRGKWIDFKVDLEDKLKGMEKEGLV